MSIKNLTPALRDFPSRSLGASKQATVLLAALLGETKWEMGEPLISLLEKTLFLILSRPPLP